MQDSTTNSLIGFLAKKSLFTNSPTKASTKKRSKSKDSKDNLNYSYREKPKLQIDQKSQTNQLKLFRQNSQKAFKKPYEEQSEPVFSPKVSPIRYQPIQRTFNKKQNSFFQNSQAVNKDIKGSQNSFFKPNRSNNNIWAGLVTQVSNFQSARVESANCLDQMSVKLHNEISNINYKIELFNNKITKVLNIEFKNLRQKINKIVQEVFKESERQMKEYMKAQQKLLAGQLLQMRQLLQGQYLKVEGMKQQIISSNWRKVAGQLISSQLQQKVQEYLRVSKNIETRQWQIGEIGGNKLYQLETLLRDMIKLNR